jgi:hypothetical protein
MVERNNDNLPESYFFLNPAGQTGLEPDTTLLTLPFTQVIFDSRPEPRIVKATDKSGAAS